MSFSKRIINGKILACVTAMLLMSFGVKGQVNFKIFDEDIGYVSHSHHIIQDDYGFLWSGTLTGLVKTDGNSYTKFTSDRTDTRTIGANFTNYLFEDRYSNIWANGYLYGLSIYDREKDEFVRIPKGSQNLHNVYISSFYEHQDSIVYFSGEAGLQKVVLNQASYRDLQFELITLPDSIKVLKDYNPHLWEIVPWSENEILIASPTGFYIFNLEEEKFYNHKDFPFLPHDKGGFSAWKDEEMSRVWFAKSGGNLGFYDFNTKEDYDFEEVRVSGAESYLQSLNDTILLFLEQGRELFVINKKTLETQSYKASENSEIGYTDIWARRFYKTKDGSVFIASGSNSRFQHIPSISPSIKSKRLLDKDDNSLSAVYNDDEFFVATFFKHGAFIKEKKSGKEIYLSTENSLNDNLVMQVKRLKDGNFLFAGAPHVYIYNPYSSQIQKIGDALFYRSAIELADETLWLFPGARRQSQFYKKNENGKYQEVNIPEDLKGILNVREAIINEDGTMWFISSLEGLFKLDKDFKIIGHWKTDNKTENSIIGNSLECMYRDSQGRLWLGALEGLSIFDEKKNSFLNLANKDGFDDTSISDIIEAEDGTIYIGTFYGLYTYDEIHKKVIRVPDSKVINSHFSQRGMSSFEGDLYMTGKGGLDIVSTASKGENIIPPLVQLCGITMNQKPIQERRNLELLDEIHISSKYRNATLEFSAIHFGGDPKRLQYKLEKDDDWTEMLDRTIELSDFRFGLSTIEVRGANAHGFWSKPKIYDIKIVPPPYATWWFYAICLLVLASIFYALYRWRLNQMLKIKEQQLEIDKQIAEIELKALKAQMNPHFVFNSLNSVKGLILDGKTDEALEYLTSFSKLIRKILNNSDEKFIRLQDEIDTIKLYLDLEAMRFDEAFTYSIKIDDHVGVDFVEVPSLILQPYIENAIWHGLLHKDKGPKDLSVSISEDNGIISIVIEDNGIGREAARRIKTRSSSKHKSLGLTINNQRIHLLKQLYGNEATINIVDVKDENGKAAGTKVIIKFKSLD